MVCNIYTIFMECCCHNVGGDLIVLYVMLYKMVINVCSDAAFISEGYVDVTMEEQMHWYIPIPIEV